MDYSLQHHQSFIGQPLSQLPTPALVIHKSVVERNIAQLHQDVESTGLAFRPHVKTLKVCATMFWYIMHFHIGADNASQCLEVVRMMLGAKHTKIVASTLAEIRGVLPLAQEGVLDEVGQNVPDSGKKKQTLTKPPDIVWPSPSTLGAPRPCKTAFDRAHRTHGRPRPAH
jgi:D-serine ammonia-lyase